MTTMSPPSPKGTSVPATLLVAIALVSWLASSLTVADEPTYTAWISLTDLVKKCNGDKAWEQAYCIGYVVGVADVANNDATGRICLPKAITQAGIKAAVTKYLARYPDASDYAAFSSVRAALRNTFPCPLRRAMGPAHEIVRIYKAGLGNATLRGNRVSHLGN